MFTDKRLEKAALTATAINPIPSVNDIHPAHSHIHHVPHPHSHAHPHVHSHTHSHSHSHSHSPLTHLQHVQHPHHTHHLQPHMTQHALQQMQHMQQQQSTQLQHSHPHQQPQQQLHHLHHPPHPHHLQQQQQLSHNLQSNVSPQHQLQAAQLPQQAQSQQPQQPQPHQHHQTQTTQHSPVHQQSQQPQQQQQQQQSSSLFSRFDANKSTKGASKLRRDLINAEIANLRDLLPLPQSTRQRLSQLQLMALVCVYVRKANYFQQVFKRHDVPIHSSPTPNVGFSKALSGFLMMLTQNGKLLYISDNAAEYLGHSMEDLLIHGDSVYDIIDKQDHAAIQAELNRNVPIQAGQHAGSSSSATSSAAAAATAALSALEGEHRMFLCRMNVSRNARRQMRFGDQKVVLVQGHYLSYLPLCSRNEPVFLATCTPIAMPETRECVVQGATNVFTTIHSMDMKIAHIDRNGEFHLGYSKSDIQGLSWYNFLHSDNLREVQTKHRLITQSEQDRSCILLVRMQRRQGDFLWVHVVLQVRDSQDNQQPVIVCTNQILNDREATVMMANSWLYHYYTVQSKIQFGLAFESSTRIPPTPGTPSAVFYHHHAHHYASPSVHSAGGNLTATYPTIHHNAHHPHHTHFPHQMPTYNAYHNEGVSPLSNANINGQSTPLNHLSNSFHGVRLGTEPVDYSQVNESVNNNSVSPSSSSVLTETDIRCSSANSTVSSNTTTQGRQPSKNHHKNGNNSNSSTNSSRMNSSSPPPPAKKRVLGKLEPLYLSSEYTGNEESSTNGHENATYYELNAHHHHLGGDSRTSVVFATVIPTRPRFLNKTLPNDPPDFMDQWNPSPPWSESAQKLALDNSSSSQQELSPCITMTPPTPTSAPPIQANGNCITNGITINTNNSTIPQIGGPAFSFEWMSDPLVPIMDPCVTCLTPDGIPMMMGTAASHPHNHATNHLTTHAGHWSASLPPANPHQHLSQHLASHGHRMLHLTNLQQINEANPNENPSNGAIITKHEVPESGEEKG